MPTIEEEIFNRARGTVSIGPALKTEQTIDEIFEKSRTTGYEALDNGNIEVDDNEIPGIENEADAMQFAATMGFADTYRGLKQLAGFDENQMRLDQKKLNAIFRNKDYGGKAFAAYAGGVVADPVGWVMPIAKAKSVSSLVKQGIAYGTGFGAAGYVDEDGGLSRLEQAGLGAVTGGVLTGALGLAGKKYLGFDNLEQDSITKIADEPEKIRQQDRAKAKRRKLLREINEKTLPEKIGGYKRPTFYQNIQGEVLYPEWERWVNNPLRGIGAGIGGGAGLYLIDEMAEPETAVGFLGQVVTGIAGVYAGARGGTALNKTEYVSDKMYKWFPKTRINPKIYQLERQIDSDVRPHYSAIMELLEETQKMSANDQKVAYNLFGGDLGKDELLDLVKGNKVTRIDKDGKEVPVEEFLDISLPADVDAIIKLSDKQTDVFKKIGEDLRLAGLLDDDLFRTNIDSYISRVSGKVEEKYGTNAAKKFVRNLEKVKGSTLKSRGYVYRDGKKTEFTVEELKKVLPKLREERARDYRISQTFGKVTDDSGYLLNRIDNEVDPQYNKNILPEEQASNMGVVISKQDNGKYKIISQLTKEERKQLGELDDVALSLAKSAIELRTTVGLGKYYDSLLKEGIQKGFVINPVSRNIKNYKGATENNPIKIDGEDYVYVPTTSKTQEGINVSPTIKGDTIKTEIPEFGNLGGNLMKLNEWKDIKLLDKLATDDKYMKLFQGNYRSMLQLWKKSKTIYNPAVHVNNYFSNYLLTHMANGKWSEVAKAHKQFKFILDYESGKIKKSDLPEDIRVLYDKNVFGSDYIDADVNFYKMFSGVKLDVDAAQKDGNFIQSAINSLKNSFLYKGAKIVDKKAGDFYQLWDRIFRLALYRSRLQQINPRTGVKYTQDEAVEDAIKWFVDYNIKDPLVNRLRNSVVPFLSFPYRVMPLLAETAITNPHKLATASALMYGLNEAGRLAAGDTKAEEAKQRKLMQDYRKKELFGSLGGVDLNIRLPYDSKYGDAKYLDVSRAVPIADLLYFGGDFPGTGEAPLPRSLIFGGPAVTGMRVAMGQDPRTGVSKEIENAGKGNTEKILSGLGDFAFDFLPNLPVIPGTFAFDKVIQSIERARKINQQYRTNADPLTITEAVLNTVGFKINTADLARLSKLKTTQAQSIISKYRKKQGSLNNKRMKNLITLEEYKEELQEIRQQLRQELNDMRVEE